MEFSASACIKLILVGDHLVVHGFPGIAVPILDKRTTVTISDGAGFVTIQATKLEWEELIGFRTELEFFCNLLEIDSQTREWLAGADFSITYGADPGLGLGISASYGVAMIRALLQVANRTITDEQLIQLLYEVEKNYHGSPSGIDHTTIILEQPILFQKGEYHLLPIDLYNSHIFNSIELINTGRPEESTREMVEYVSGKATPALLEDWEKLSTKIPSLIQALQDDDVVRFRNIINFYGEALEKIPVVSERVKIKSREIRENKRACKITGAGGLKEGCGMLLVV